MEQLNPTSLWANKKKIFATKLAGMGRL